VVFASSRSELSCVHLATAAQRPLTTTPLPGRIEWVEYDAAAHAALVGLAASTAGGGGSSGGC
jgi:hypothetical protein